MTIETIINVSSTKPRECYAWPICVFMIRARTIMETGRTWILWRYVANKGDVVGFDHFSASAPYKILHKKLG